VGHNEPTYFSDVPAHLRSLDQSDFSIAWLYMW